MVNALPEFLHADTAAFAHATAVAHLRATSLTALDLPADAERVARQEAAEALNDHLPRNTDEKPVYARCERRARQVVFAIRGVALGVHEARVAALAAYHDERAAEFFAAGDEASDVREAA